MICEECKRCENYDPTVDGLGCHGSTEPCMYFETEFTRAMKAVKSAAETLSNSFDIFTLKSDGIKSVDPSRRRFEAVACKGRNRKRK